jgi:hypothetical protein
MPRKWFKLCIRIFTRVTIAIANGSDLLQPLPAARVHHHFASPSTCFGGLHLPSDSLQRAHFLVSCRVNFCLQYTLGAIIQQFQVQQKRQLNSTLPVCSNITTREITMCVGTIQLENLILISICSTVPGETGPGVS